MDLVLNNLQRLICRQTQLINQQTNLFLWEYLEPFNYVQIIVIFVYKTKISTD